MVFFKFPFSDASSHDFCRPPITQTKKLLETNLPQSTELFTNKYYKVKNSFSFYNLLTVAAPELSVQLKPSEVVQPPKTIASHLIEMCQRADIIE